MSNLACKLGPIGPKWDKSGTFKDQFQYILANLTQFDINPDIAKPKCTESDLKNPRFVPFVANLIYFG